MKATGRHIWLLQKVTKWFPRCKIKTKWVKIKGRSYEEAKSFMEVLNPGWEVSMYWPEYL